MIVLGNEFKFCMSSILFCPRTPNLKYKGQKLTQKNEKTPEISFPFKKDVIV